jgi:hypothetical protein
VKKLYIALGLVLAGPICLLSQENSHQGTRRHKAAASQSTPSTPTPSPGPASKKQKGTAAAAGGKDEQKGPTEITAKQEAQFDTSTHSGVFLGDVKVVDPQFTMTCDKLTVHLNKDQDGGGLHDAIGEGNVMIAHLNQPKAAPSPGASPQGSATPVAQSSPGAQASPSPGQPVLSTGRAERAFYQGSDGSVTLTGWPQVTQGENTQVATDPDVKMILFKDGRMKTFGSTRTVIKSKESPTGSPANSPTSNNASH